MIFTDSAGTTWNMRSDLALEVAKAQIKSGQGAKPVSAQICNQAKENELARRSKEPDTPFVTVFATRQAKANPMSADTLAGFLNSGGGRRGRKGGIVRQIVNLDKLAHDLAQISTARPEDLAHAEADRKAKQGK